MLRLLRPTRLPNAASIAPYPRYAGPRVPAGVGAAPTYPGADVGPADPDGPRGTIGGAMRSIMFRNTARAPGVGGGGGAGGYAGATVIPTPGLVSAGAPMSPMLQNARQARRAATFAENSPLPTDADGNYDGAYGKGPDAQRRAMGARKAFVDDQRDLSNVLTGNYYDGEEFAHDANDRANGQAAADVDYTGSAAGLNDANAYHLQTDADTVMPSVAARNYAAGKYDDARAASSPMLAKYAADAEAARAQAQQHKELLASREKELAAVRAENRQLKGKLIPQAGRGSATDRIIENLAGDAGNAGGGDVAPAGPTTRPTTPATPATSTPASAAAPNGPYTPIIPGRAGEHWPTPSPTTAPAAPAAASSASSPMLRGVTAPADAPRYAPPADDLAGGVSDADLPENAASIAAAQARSAQQQQQQQQQQASPAAPSAPGAPAAPGFGSFMSGLLGRFAGVGGATPGLTPAPAAPATATTPAIARPRTPAEAAALAPGTRFYDPSGRVRTR